MLIDSQSIQLFFFMYSTSHLPTENISKTMAIETARINHNTLVWNTWPTLDFLANQTVQILFKVVLKTK